VTVRSRTAWVSGVAATLLIAGVAGAAKRAPEASGPGLRELGERYETIVAGSGADRIEALESLDRSVADVLRGGEGDESRRAAARFLAARLRADLGDFRGAMQGFPAGTAADPRGRFADDAAFAAIEAMEAAGDDAGASREWARWEKRFPQSPLLPAARLAQAWNALRRGETAAARGALQDLANAHAWMARQPRFQLAQATAMHLDGKHAEALVVLGPKPTGAGALYLRALCLEAQGSTLQAAATFQELGERHGDSPLRDHALLAKANTFLRAGDHRSAAEEMGRVAGRVHDPKLRAEAELRQAGAVMLAGGADSALALLRGVVERHPGTDVAARAQFLVGEALAARGRHAEAIVELNRVLRDYFQHSVAAGAQYRVARCLDAMGRRTDATGSYQAVVSGYPLEPEAPAAAYLAGVGLMDQGKPVAAAPYFQIVLDRYAARSDSRGHLVFTTSAHQELVEAALCMLQVAWHRAGNLGQLSGAPHLLLQKMPESRSPWRAWALLIDADASAAQARYPESQGTLEKLMREFPDHAVGASAARLLAWTYSRQGRDSLAIATEERLIARWGAGGQDEIVSACMLDIAHDRFNQKRYRDAAAAYESFLRRYPTHPKRSVALYHAGLCYVRVDRAGDAVDRWEAIVKDSASSPLAERAWARAGDLYFQAERYGEARRCYRGLLEHFAESPAAAVATLRLAQCEYNAGRDGAALESYAAAIARFPGTPVAREAARGQELALYRLSQSADGATTLAKLVEQYPTSAFAADAQFQIARRHFREKRWAEAAEGFRQVVSRFPGYSSADEAQFLAAEALAAAGERDRAREVYEQFLAFFSDSRLKPTVHFRLGLMRFESKDYLQAGIDFTRALEDSAGPEVRTAGRYNLALCQRLLGRGEEARVELERYRADFPGDARAAEVAYQLGDLHEAAGRPADAAREFEAAMAAGPRGALGVEVLFRLGRCREGLQDVDGAIRAYRQASLTPDPDQPFRLSSVARLAALYESRRDVTRAITAYRDLVRNARDRELVAAAAGRVSQLEKQR